jgi:hypothetical protein
MVGEHDHEQDPADQKDQAEQVREEESGRAAHA